MFRLIATSVVCVLALTTAAPASAQDVVPRVPVIIVNGEATVRRAPDVAFVTVAVETRAPGPREAQRQNGAAMAAVQKQVLAGGIPREALRTIGVRLEQEFDFSNSRRVPRGYLARNTLEVRVEDLARAGEIADTAVAAGATAIDSIRFELKDRGDAMREALKLAVADARARAEAAAAGAGRSVDQILRIEEGGRRSAGPPAVMMARAPMQAEGSAAMIAEPGLIEVAADVTLTVSIR